MLVMSALHSTVVWLRVPLIIPVQRLLGFAGFDAAYVMRSTCHNLGNESGSLGLGSNRGSFRPDYVEELDGMRRMTTVTDA